MENSAYQIELAVRDYECDIQGIVNNSVYQNYLEHARHEYLKSLGINFADYALRGINLVVVRAEIDYKYSLKSGDKFAVRVKMEKLSRVKFAFIQDILRLPDKQISIQARIIGTALNQRGRPQIPEEFNDLIEEKRD